MIFAQFKAAYRLFVAVPQKVQESHVKMKAKEKNVVFKCRIRVGGALEVELDHFKRFFELLQALPVPTKHHVHFGQIMNPHGSL